MTLRVVQISTNKLPCPPQKGGAIERYIYGISRELAKKGIEVHIISLPGWEKSSMFKYEKNVVHHSIDLGLYKLISFHSIPEIGFATFFGKKLSNVIREIERDYGAIDIISSHYPTTSFGPLYIRKRSVNVRIVHHIHNTYGGRSITGMQMRSYLKYTLRYYDVVCGVSAFVKDWLIKELSLPRQRIAVIYNAIDSHVFRPFTTEEKEKIRESYGLEGSFVLLFIGRITPDKGLDQIIKALVLLKRRGINKLKLLVVGPKGQFYKDYEKYYDYILRLISMYGLSNMVKYFGHVSLFEAPRLYSISDIVVVPSLFDDSCPSVVLESLACGRPVVAYDSGGIRELIPPHGGIVVPKGDVRALADAIECYWRSEMQADSEDLYRYIVNNFSYQAVTKRLLKIYNELK